MATEEKYIINRSTLVEIADAVRNLTDITGKIEVSDIAPLLNTVKPAASGDERVKIIKVTKVITLNQSTENRITVTKVGG